MFSLECIWIERYIAADLLKGGALDKDKGMKKKVKLGRDEQKE